MCVSLRVYSCVQMEPVDRSTCEELSDHVDKLVTTGQKELDAFLLKKIKNVCKKSDLYVEHTFHIIMTYLEKEHAQIRYSCLGLINELFQRSYAFRNLLLTDFQRFLELTAETDPQEPLPPPKNVAKDLRIKTLQVVQEWHNEFSDGYKKLKLAYNFLRTCKKIDFNNIDVQNEAQRRTEEEERQQQERNVAERIAKVKVEIEEFSPEISSTIMQLNNCLQILLPPPDELFEATDFSDPLPCCSKTLAQNMLYEAHTEMKADTNDCEEITQETEKVDDIVKEHGLGNLKYNISINVTSAPSVEQNENTISVIETMKEFLQQVQLKFIPLVTKWLQILGKGGRSSCVLLKRAIDLKNDLKTVADKCAKLKIYTPPKVVETSEDSDNEEFEEVKDKEGFEPIIPEHRRNEYGLSGVTTNKNQVKSAPKDWSLITTEDNEIHDPTSRLANVFAHYRKISGSGTDLISKDALEKSEPSKNGQQPAPLESNTKKKLLSEAPRRPYDIDLYYWEEEKLEAPEIIKFDSQHKFCKPLEGEMSEIRKQEDIAAMRMRRIEFIGQFVPVKWSCRAPLPSGRLCPRQDRYKCPFHGVIIPRDEMGNPSVKDDKPCEKPDNTESRSEIPDWQDPQYLQELKAATGIDLALPSTSKALKKNDAKKQCKKYPALIDVKKIEDNSRKRLEKKVLNKGALKRVAETLDTIDQKRFRDKYGNQWQYAFET